MLCFSNDKGGPEITFFPELITFHIWSILRVTRQSSEVRKRQRMVPGSTAPPFWHLHRPPCFIATNMNYLSSGSLPPLLLRDNNIYSVFLSTEFNVWSWLAAPHSAETPHPTAPAANAAGGQKFPFWVLPWPMLRDGGGGREAWCLSSLFNNRALLKYH